MKFDKFTDVCMTGGIHHTPSHTNVCKFLFFFSTYIFSADITPDMLKLCRVTNKVLFLVLVCVFNLTYLNFWPPFWRRVSFFKVREKSWNFASRHKNS